MSKVYYIKDEQGRYLDMQVSGGSYEEISGGCMYSNEADVLKELESLKKHGLLVNDFSIECYNFEKITEIDVEEFGV
ncbi:hypothetical protein D3C76_1807500 [compost metagenome]